MRNAWVPLVLSLLAFLAGIGAGELKKRPQEQVDLEKIAASDPRIEYVARQICKARGLDPDHDDPPYPGPLWERFILEARDFVAADDALELWIRRGAPASNPSPGRATNAQ